MRPALVCGITSDLDFALANLLIGFQRHNPDFAGDVVVFHDGLTGAQQRLLSGIGPRLQFRGYDRDRMLNRLGAQETDATRARLAEIVQRYSPMMLAKLELPDLLADYSHAVWMDADMLVRGPLPDLFAFDALAWRPLPEGWQKRRGPLLTRFENLWRHRDTPFPNGGLIGIAKGSGVTSAALYALARQVLEDIDIQSIDEAAWFLAASSRGEKVHGWPMGYNHPPNREGLDSALVVHAIGPRKFWNAASLMSAFPEWRANQAIWVALGGKPWAGRIEQTEVEPIALHERIRAADHRDHWLRVFDALREDWPTGLLPDLRHHHRDWMIHICKAPHGARIVLGMTPNPRKLRVRLSLDAPMAQVPGLVARLEPALAIGGAGFDLEPRRDGLEYEAVVPIAKLPRVLVLLRDAALRLDPINAKSGAQPD